MQFLSDYLKEEYGAKLYKLSFDLGCTCPNRDGTVGTGGCIFCSAGGSGEFAERVRDVADIDAAIERAKLRVRGKAHSDRYIAYFQAYTNTYGDLNHLEEIYRAFQRRDEIELLSIATRPDCLGPEVLHMLERLQRVKPVWVELGLQTIHEETARRIRRGYELSVFEEAYRNLKELKIPVITHVILGLPGETKDDMRETIAWLAALEPSLDGIKLSLLHVLRGTELARQWERGEAKAYDFTPEEYAAFAAELVHMLPQETVVHRMTGDGDKRELLHPMWTADKKRVLNLLQRNFACVVSGIKVY